MRTEKSESTDAASTPIAADAGRTPVDVSPTPKPVSGRKRAANRADAVRSTGPTSPEGKARSSMNAVRHGLAARASLLPGEDADELEQLTREMEDDLRPRGAAQREVVGRIVSLSWRLRRLARAEEAMCLEENADRAAGHERCMRARAAYGMTRTPLDDDDYQDPPVPATGPQFLARQFAKARGNAPLERMAVYEQRTDRALHAAFRQFQQLRKMRDSDDAQDSAVQNEPTVEPPPCSRRACSARPAEEENGEQARRLHEDVVSDAPVQNEPTGCNKNPRGATKPHNGANEATARTSNGEGLEVGAAIAAASSTIVQNEPTAVNAT